MISFRDMTFCNAPECAKFSTCHRALTPDVIASAIRWWRGPNPPICQFSKPKENDCYEPTQHDQLGGSNDHNYHSAVAPTGDDAGVPRSTGKAPGGRGACSSGGRKRAPVSLPARDAA